MDRHQLKLNADLGEGAGNDSVLMPYLEMCNISCGAHAGDLSEIENTMRLAQKHQIKIGAHPSYPDRENFGRQIMDISEADLLSSLTEQLETFKAIANKLNVTVHHIKAHGALYHQVASNETIKNIFLQAVDNSFDDINIIIPSSYYAKMSNFGYHTLLYEAFADRQYLPNLQLLSRSQAEALITNTEDLANQLYKLLECGKVFTSDGSWQDIYFDTICIHGDSPGIAERLPMIIAILENQIF